MRPLELVIWSMALGAIAAVGLARLANLALRPSVSQALGVAYHATVFTVVLLLCGILTGLQPALDPRTTHVMQVLAGPLVVALANFWLRGWLSAPSRDRITSFALYGSALVLPVMALACLALPQAQQLPAAGAVALLGSILTVWLTVRAWLMGDSLALGMTAGCTFTLPTMAGLYAIAMHLPAMGLAMQAIIAASAACGNAVVGLVLWQRDRQGWQARQADSPALLFDPVTRLHSGSSLVRKLILAQRRRSRTRREGAVIAAMVFDVDAVTVQIGTGGVNEMFIAIANRIQRQVGVVNPVGRYYDRCFICLVETIQSPASLRTLGLRVASSLRRPIEVNTAHGDRVQVRVDIGVGVVHLPHGHAQIEDILHDAQRMAEAGRAMRSGAAILDSATGEVVPVEKANLGPRRRPRANRAPSSSPPRAMRS
ncbi:MAG: diguanylate cyclase [Ramlibacter sp.]